MYNLLAALRGLYIGPESGTVLSLGWASARAAPASGSKMRCGSFVAAYASGKPPFLPPRYCRKILKWVTYTYRCRHQAIASLPVQLLALKDYRNSFGLCLRPQSST